MADEYSTKRIINLPAESGPAAGDVFVVDNESTGTKKLPITGLIDSTLSKSGQAADAQVVGNGLKNMSELFIYEQPALSATSGLLYFPVSNGDSLTIKRVDGQAFANPDQVRFYDANRNYIRYVSTPAGSESRTWTYPDDTPAVYIGLTLISASSPAELCVTNNSSKSLLLAEINARKSADHRLDILDEQSAKKEIINRFNKATISAGKFISTANGTLTSNESFFASDYINIKDLSSVTVSRTHIFGWYDANKNWIGHPDSMNSINNDLTVEVPENAEYLRFSAYNAALDTAQVGESVSRYDYVPYGIYTLPGLQINQSQIEGEEEKIIVDASGSGDYTSLTQALYENVDSKIDIVVKPGTYDIVAEYVALFGQSAVDNMADTDSSVFNGFQYGAIIRNRKIFFEPGSHVVCDWTGHTVDGTHRFSALRVDYNCEIFGLDLVATATFYAIHDDYGLTVPYTVKYENCRIEGVNLTNANCIGGGCKKYSRHILKNCYFDNHLTGSATVRYHNTNADGAEPEVYVSNCYFNNWFTPRWYGTQTSKMRVYVNNCEARSIHKLQESASFNVDNVELFKWCNTETSPVT